MRSVHITDTMLALDDIRGVLRACPGLQRLGLLGCSWSPGSELAEEKPEDVKFQSWSAWNCRESREFQTWSRLQTLDLKFSCEVLRSLVSNGSLVELHALREFDIDVWVLEDDDEDYYGDEDGGLLDRSDFDAMARLSKLTTLSLQDAPCTGAYATRILPRLSSLQELVVNGCDSVTSALWAALPPTLVILRASGTSLLTDVNGNAATGGCGGVGGSLRVLDAPFTALEDCKRCPADTVSCVS